MSQKKKPIFIHSLFRTGSTYIWNKFRKNRGYYCYYEPLHPVLAELTPMNVHYMMTSDFVSVHHPPLDDYYLQEYLPLLKESQVGLPYFDRAFGFDQFCRNSENPQLKQYIDSLIDAAGDRVPVLQFNRTAFRGRWFKTNYPGALNIYLTRDPRDQWNSYFELYKRTDYIPFFVMDLLAVSLNKDKKAFHELSKKLPLFAYRNDEGNRQEHFYRIIMDSYSDEEKYLVFYYIWLKALVENVGRTDLFLNINLLSEKSSYKERVNDFFIKKGIQAIDFSDAEVATYNQFPLAVQTMEQIEKMVQNILSQSITPAQVDAFFRELPSEDKRYFKLKKSDFLSADKTESSGSEKNIRLETIDKLERIVQLITEEHFQQIDNNETLEREIRTLELRMFRQEKQTALKRNDLAKMDRKKLEKEVFQLWEMNALSEERISFISQKEKLLSELKENVKRKNNIISEKDLQLSKLTEQLKQKTDEIQHNYLQLSEKDKLLAQKISELKKEDQLLWERNERLEHQALIIAEKDLQLSERDEQLKRAEEEIEKRNCSLAAKQRKLSQKDTILRQKDQVILRKSNELEQTGTQLLEQKELVMQLQHRVRKINRSYTYRIGRLVTAPLEFGKGVILKNTRRLSRLSRNAAGSVSAIFGNYEKKINIEEQLRLNYGRHRSGWNYAVGSLSRLHSHKGILMDAFIERTFCWHPDGVRSHTEPWIGFIHIPPGIPKWFFYDQANEMVFKTDDWKKSLPFCKGLFTLSEYHKRYLETLLDVPVNSLLFPTDLSPAKWDWEKFSTNKEKKIIQVGWWLRKLHAIYQLPRTDYKKIFLNVGHESLPGLIKKEREILIKEGSFKDSMYETAESLDFLTNETYDEALCTNIVFINLYDASANNTIIECIARGTPILVNPIEAVKEYLGENYPFYYNTFEEAAEKASDRDLIYKTHLFLADHPIKKKLTGEYFLNSFADSSIYRGLDLKNAGRRRTEAVK